MRSAGESNRRRDEDFQAALEEGVRLFNEGAFWEAHEAWEGTWLKSEGERKLFIQGLIQLAAAFHLVRRQRFSGARRLFDASRDKLSTFSPSAFGVERLRAETVASECRRKIVEGEAVESELPVEGALLTLT